MHQTGENMNGNFPAKLVASDVARFIITAAIACALSGLAVITASAGSLTPPGPPGSTMRTMEELKPAWNNIIPVPNGRFVDAMNGFAVLDKETGLVWAKTPDSLPRNWKTSNQFCTQLFYGGRMGWRLPTIDELSSLIAIDATGTLRLPDGNPFQNAQPNSYWSSSSPSSGIRWAIKFNTDPLNIAPAYDETNSTVLTWCVRGGQ
jgi:hypothetical protein